MQSSSSSSSTTSRLLLVVGAAAASGACCLALVLAVGACTATTGGVAGYSYDGRPRPPSTSSLVGYSMADAARVNYYYPAGWGRSGGGSDLAGGAAAEQDYGFVDPTPDTRRRGGTAPIPHN